MLRLPLHVSIVKMMLFHAALLIRFQFKIGRKVKTTATSFPDSPRIPFNSEMSIYNGSAFYMAWFEMTRHVTHCARAGIESHSLFQKAKFYWSDSDTTKLTYPPITLQWNENKSLWTYSHQRIQDSGMGISFIWSHTGVTHRYNGQEKKPVLRNRSVVKLQ